MLIWTAARKDSVPSCREAIEIRSNRGKRSLIQMPEMLVPAAGVVKYMFCRPTALDGSKTLFHLFLTVVSFATTLGPGFKE